MYLAGWMKAVRGQPPLRLGPSATGPSADKDRGTDVVPSGQVGRQDGHNVALI